MADVTPIEEAPPRRTQEAPAAPQPRGIEPRRTEPRGIQPVGIQPGGIEPLWREVLGERLRELRADREETLVDTARRAGISPQYLSEIERGIKEPSSEMISAVAGALDTSLAEIASDIGRDLTRRAVVPARATFFALAA